MFPGRRDRIHRFVYYGPCVASTSDPRRVSVRREAVALACALALACTPLGLAGCFRDLGPGALCAGADCLTGASTSGTGAASSTVAPTTTMTTTTTGASGTTGAPVDPAITMRIATMEFVDPHLFITEQGMETDTEGTADSCVNDVTTLVNSVLNGDLADGKFNLLMHFEDFAELRELRLVDGDCEDPTQPGGMRVCTPSEASPAVILNTELIEGPGCRQLEEGVYAAITVPMIKDPGPPCLRTKRAFFSLPVSDAVGSLDLRDAQFVATFDDPVTPTKLFDGVVYGFLPMAAAQALEIEAPLFGLTNLWSVIEASACTAAYPDYLPSVDKFMIGDVPVPGVWVAINFTAEQVEYRPQG